MSRRTTRPARSEAKPSTAKRTAVAKSKSTPRFRTFDEAFAWLSASTNYETMATQRYDERTYGLARVEALLDALGRPDHSYVIAQVVGSKGKGSTAATLAAILHRSRARRPVGLFTSPHLIHPRERIMIGGKPARDTLFVRAVSELVPHAEAAAARGEALTFFELHTAAALLVFRAAKCRTAVLEAGMGGRLDATTAARSSIQILTSVSLDHTAQLGRTTSKIAEEKAAVARRGRPFVCGVPPTDPASRAIESVVRANGGVMHRIGEEFSVTVEGASYDAASRTGLTLFWLFHRGRPDELAGVNLYGACQARNAALAAVAARLGTWPGGEIHADDIYLGLLDVSIRARFETISDGPAVVVDGAHTPASFRALAHSVASAFGSRPILWVVGISSDKDVNGCLRILRGRAHHVFTTSSGQARAAPSGSLASRAARLGLEATPIADPLAALAAARRMAASLCTLRHPAGGAVIVTGSLYLCGAVLAAQPPTTIRPS